MKGQKSQVVSILSGKAGEQKNSYKEKSDRIIPATICFAAEKQDITGISSAERFRISGYSLEIWRRIAGILVKTNITKISREESIHYIREKNVKNILDNKIYRV